MSKNRPLTVSQMFLALISCKSENEFICLWNAFVDLRQHGFISPTQWLRFLNGTKDWYFDTSKGCVISSYSFDEVLF